MSPALLSLVLACAPALVSVRGEDDGVQARLNGGFGRRRFELVSPEYGVLDHDRPSRRVLRFDLPDAAPTGDGAAAQTAMYIRDTRTGALLGWRGGDAGPLVFDAAPWGAALACQEALQGARVRADAAALRAACTGAAGLQGALDRGLQLVALEHERRATSEALAELDRRAAAAAEDAARATRQLQDDAAFLATSRAWVGGRCVQPTSTAAAEPPLLACRPEHRRLHASGMCAASWAIANGVPATDIQGCEGVKDALELRGYTREAADLVDGPACEVAIQAALTGETDAGAILADISRGAALESVDRVADRGLADDNPLLAFGGLLLKLFVGYQELKGFAECVDKVGDRCVSLWREWQEEVEWPARQARECAARVEAAPGLRARVERGRAIQAEAQRTRPAFEAELAVRAQQVEAAEAALLVALRQPAPVRAVALDRSSDAELVAQVRRAAPAPRRPGDDARRAWGGLGAGAGYAVLLHPPGSLQGAADALGPGHGYDLTAHFGWAPLRVGADLRGGATRHEQGFDTFGDAGTTDLDDLHATHVHGYGWVELLPLSTVSPRFTPVLGAGLAHGTTTLRGSPEDDPADDLADAVTTTRAFARVGAALAPTGGVLRLRVVGDLERFPGQGWIPTCAATVELGGWD